MNLVELRSSSLIRPPIKMDDDDDDVEGPEPLSTTVLGSLTPGKIEQATIDLVLEEDEEYLFEIVGKNTVFLTGNYIDQVGPDNAPYDDDSEDDMDEDAYDLREVSSDVEVNEDEIDILSDDEDAHRFEEIDEAEESKSLKHPRDSDATETLSKSQQKKLNKKLKAEGGKAVAAGSAEEEKKTKKEEKGKGEKKEKQKEKDDVVVSEQKDKEKSVTLDTKTLQGGLKVKDVTIGTGPKAKNGKTVSMRYVGKYPNGELFDSNTKGKALSFCLGKGAVIKGWDIGILGMQVGGERELIVPPAMGYGNKANGKIPPGSTLVFTCKLLDIK